MNALSGASLLRIYSQALRARGRRTWPFLSKRDQAGRTGSAIGTVTLPHAIGVGGTSRAQRSIGEQASPADRNVSRTSSRLKEGASDPKVESTLHDLNFASCYSDYVVAMRSGEVVHHGMPDEIITTQVIRDVYDMDVDIRDIGGGGSRSTIRNTAESAPDRRCRQNDPPVSNPSPPKPPGCGNGDPPPKPESQGLGP